jgi:hypothetical protein
MVPKYVGKHAMREEDKACVKTKERLVMVPQAKVCQELEKEKFFPRNFRGPATALTSDL